jgi:hypothetical protein
MAIVWKKVSLSFPSYVFDISICRHGRNVELARMSSYYLHMR